MIDKAVAKMDGATAVCIRMDGRRVFTEYALEYIDEMLKHLLTEAFAKRMPAEKFDERIKQTIAENFSKAAYLVAIERFESLLERSPDDLMQIVTEIAKGEEVKE